MSPLATISPSFVSTYPIKALHFQGMFSKEEKQHLTDWIKEGFDWFQQTFGTIDHPNLTIACSRRCFGEGRYQHRKQKITIKATNNKEYFIATFIHELAHWVTFTTLKKKVKLHMEWELQRAYLALVEKVYESSYIQAKMEEVRKSSLTYYHYYNKNEEKIARMVEAIYLYQKARPSVIQERDREFNAETYLEEVAPTVSELMTYFVEAMNYAIENEAYEAQFQELKQPSPTYWEDEESENLFL